EAERQGTWVLHNVARIEPEGPEAEADVVIQVEAGGPPTAVSLSRWDAVGGDGGVTHTWTTAFEKGIELFRVYRGAELATAQLVGEVTAQGRAADYRFVDGGLAAGTYYYWLVEVDGSGAEGQRFGPKSVVVGTSGQRLDGWKVYLPLTLKPER
ncbi:MAG: hypothetical protein HPY83_19640, partial [Anaerolineae bacterium]|nr:hypothetical protein [Anaerolineae bacterium]